MDEALSFPPLFASLSTQGFGKLELQKLLAPLAGLFPPETNVDPIPSTSGRGIQFQTYTTDGAGAPAETIRRRGGRRHKPPVASVLGFGPAPRYEEFDEAAEQYVLGKKAEEGRQGEETARQTVSETREQIRKGVKDAGEAVQEVKQKAKGRLSTTKLRVKVKNVAAKRLISGAFAGAVSRTAVAPLETLRTHLMVGSNGKNIGEVFSNILANEGWRGLFRGNGVNVLRVAPSKAIELFAFDTVKRILTPKDGSSANLPAGLPVATVAGASAGLASTLCTYPLELLKTRLTIQRGVYTGMGDALTKIVREEGFQELYRGLTPSLIGVIPYAAVNYYAYDSLKATYRKVTKKDKVGNLATLFIGSLAGAIASGSTFPLEVARKQMQVGAVSGHIVYRDVFHALSSILKKEGVAGLYRGLGPSWMKLMPAAGMSFMCYEACKRILIEDEQQRMS
ncbi:mitochondrial substrate carrier family protein [Klebsormidium nitens]|uniref:Mitochondrial substrate carrier family protein n=1 Tax=Klebsormidium nitens TaxID=105231 RepID=A0A1Y1IBB2_KLENI|nr:mitochondrial substrate carrier family protein [Klebsormidium nitens]|eukprot:GAQ86007.1 mitochondrial substrate carrier family protein [Klebsormidium nitens]